MQEKAKDKRVKYEAIGALIISVFSLIISVLSYLEVRRQNTLIGEQNSLETTPLYHISAEIGQDLPLELVNVESAFPVATIFEDVANPNDHVGTVTFWIYVRVTNIGVRPFSISKLDSCYRPQ